MSGMFKSILMAASCCLILAVTPAGAADLKSPDDIKTCLRILMQVTNDFEHQIDRQTYQRLAHENMEFGEGVEALNDVLAKEDAGLRDSVSPAVQKAVAAAQHVVDLSDSKDDAKLRAAQADMVTAVKAVFAFFPEDLRPDPNVQPGYLKH